MTSHQSIVISLTGGIACGKSEVGRIFREEGLSVLDTDGLAHELMRSSGSVFSRIIDAFGNDIVGDDGEIDRKVLGAIVFADDSAREMLNELTHPAVIAASEEWKKKQSSDAVVIVPLLFEVGWVENWDATVCVSADESLVLERLKQRGLSKEAASQRIAAQMPLVEKEKKADLIIRNNGTLSELRKQAMHALKQIQNRESTYE